jgi:hypothetical protein
VPAFAAHIEQRQRARGQQGRLQRSGRHTVGTVHGRAGCRRAG